MAHPPDVLRDLVRRTPLYGRLRSYKLRMLHEKWIREGRPDPPSHVFKQGVVKDFAGRFGLGVLVETGTYLGDMVFAMKDVFDEIYSIELNPKFYGIAKRRFAGEGHVTIVHGDSGEVLGEVLARIDSPCLFWLDGHYTKGKFTIKGDRETPIERELRHIAGHSKKGKDVILIDDARDYTGAGDYPSVDRLREWAKQQAFEEVIVEGDIIRIFNRT